jgi:tetratricopeptide (TPR) repeat protein
MNADGSDQRQLTSRPAIDTTPSWRPVPTEFTVVPPGEPAENSEEEDGLLFEDYLNEGIVYFLQDEYGEAIDLLSEAIALQPLYVDAYLLRGQAYYLIGQFMEVAADFEKAVALSPEYTDAYLYQGLALASSGRLYEAVDDFNQAIELDPNYATAYYFRGMAQGDLNRPDQMLADLQKARELGLDPEFDAEAERMIEALTQ